MHPRKMAIAAQLYFKVELTLAFYTAASQPAERGRLQGAGRGRRGQGEQGGCADQQLGRLVGRRLRPPPGVRYARRNGGGGGDMVFIVDFCAPCQLGTRC
jgi:hypothetical protein